MRNLLIPASRVLVFACIAAIGLQSIASLHGQDASTPHMATVERVMEALRERTGADPFECGRYSKPVTDEFALAASAQCVINAATQKRPSWTVVYGPGADWRVAYGAFSGSDGRLQAFTYDSRGPTGDGRATLEVKTCSSLKFVVKDQGRSVAGHCVLV
jgi:hypothetical protein